MRSFHGLVFNTRTCALLVFIAVFSVFCVATPRSRAIAPALTVSVTNDSTREIRHFYVAPAGTDNWSGDQITDPIAAGSSRNVNVSWNDSTIKLVAEDEDGCFLTTTVDASGTPSWTINNNTARDCGFGQ